MRKSIVKIRGIGYVAWHAKHMLVHMALGVFWAWYLAGVWGQMPFLWYITSAIGSVLPDADHFLYFLTYGKNDPYTVTIRTLFTKKEYRSLVRFMENGHKSNTNLTFHNMYTLAILSACCLLSLVMDWKLAALLTGTMVTHYVFDIVDDVLCLGKINKNWFRLGRIKISNHNNVSPGYAHDHTV